MKKTLFVVIITFLLSSSVAFAHDYSSSPYWSSESLRADEVEDREVRLYWSGARDDDDVTKYRIYKNDNLLTTLYSSSTSYRVTGLQPDTFYEFRIEAGDSDGNWSDDGPELRVETRKSYYNDDYYYNYNRDYSTPTWPDKFLHATNISATSALLAWSRAEDNAAVTGYRIYKDGKIITTVKERSFNVTGLEPDASYLFNIEAGDENGNWSNNGPTVLVKTSQFPNAVVKSNFKDIKGHWAESVIDEMHQKGIVDGATADTFSPDSNITRAEFSAILINALNLQVSPPESIFADVQKDSWYAGVITTAFKNGLVSGSGNKFFPNNNITRQEIASILVAVIQQKGLTIDWAAVTNYGDFDKTHAWAKAAMKQAVGIGLITGVENNQLNPLGNATRAEAVVIIQRLLNKI